MALLYYLYKIIVLLSNNPIEPTTDTSDQYFNVIFIWQYFVLNQMLTSFPRNSISSKTYRQILRSLAVPMICHPR